MLHAINEVEAALPLMLVLEGALVMGNPEILDSLFCKAVSTINFSGAWLRTMIDDALEGYFNQPYSRA